MFLINLSIKKKILIILCVLIIVASLAPFLKLAFIPGILFIYIVLTLFVSFLFPKTGLFLIIFIRPCLDIFSTNYITNLNNLRINLASLLAIITIVFACYVAIIYRAKLAKIPLKIPLILFLAISLFSIIITPYLFLSITEFIRLLSIFSLYILCFALISNNDDLIKLLKIIIFSAMIPSCIAYWQFITKTGLVLPYEGIYNRVYGTFGHPSPFAFFLLIPISLGLFFFLAGNKRKVENIFLLILSFLYAIPLILTFTRGAWFSLFLILFIIGIFKFRKFLLIIIILGLLTYFFIPLIHARIYSLTDFSRYSSIEWRLNLWKDLISLSKENIYFGQGLGTAQIISYGKLSYLSEPTFSHNDYLKILFENGIAGVALYLLLLFSVLGYLIKFYFQISNKNLKTLLVFILALTLSLFLASLTDNILRSTALMWAYWALLGSLFSILLKQKQSEKILSPK